MVDAIRSASRPGVSTFIAATDCVDELRRVAELAEDVDRFLSRRFFRNNSIISEGTWDRYFGTFQEFKRQAQIELSRGAHRQELNVARHASKDAYRAINIDKANWGDKFLRPDPKRFQTVLGCNDLHDIHCDPFWRRVFLSTAAIVKPEKVVINGDALDLPEFGKYNVDPRTWDVVGRIRWLHAFLKDLREACPDTEIIYIEGNHEFRLLRHLGDATPAMRAILSDLHGMNVSSLLGLSQFEINYVSRTDLAAEHRGDIASELKKNWHCMYDCLIASHYPEAKSMGFPGWNGHHHSHKAETLYSPLFGEYEWHQFGVGHRRSAEYTAGERWSNGFGIIHVDTFTKSVVIEHFHVRDFAVIGGTYYERAPSERIFLS